MKDDLKLKLDEPFSPLALVEYRKGRNFSTSATLGLSDCSFDGNLRLDAAARIAQNIASADLADSGLEAEGIWVVRRTHLRFFGALRYQDTVGVSTFCAGYGRAWAQRRTTLLGSNQARVEVSSLWVLTDANTRSPKTLSENFHFVYGPSACERRVASQLQIKQCHTGEELPWKTRATDVDLLGHINNAAYFEAVEEACYVRNFDRAAMANAFVIAEYRDGVNLGDDLAVHVCDLGIGDFQVDFVVGNRSQCSLVFGCQH